MRRARRAMTIGVVVAAAAGLVACDSSARPAGDAAEEGGPFEPVGITSWPASVPRPSLPLVEEYDVGLAYMASYDLDGSDLEPYAATLVDAGFAAEPERTYSDGEHLVLLETELGRLFVTILRA